jgi:sigma-B regulation protein RsbQ
MSVLRRNNVSVSGPEGARPMMFVHGFGCDQTMWRLVTPTFAGRYRIVLLDQVGLGRSDLSAYDPRRYSSLEGYARDLVEIADELDLHDVVLVGHSVSGMTGLLATLQRPERFGALVLVAPSPRYLDDEGYSGGFTREDIDGLLEALDSNYLGWSGTMAPVIMGAPDRPDLEEELTNSFCRTDPEIARDFARVTFLSDNRADLALVKVPTLVLQCSNDALAPDAIGEYVARAIPDSVLVHLAATGHCPNLSAPRETADAIAAFLAHQDVPG